MIGTIEMVVDDRKRSLLARAEMGIYTLAGQSCEARFPRLLCIELEAAGVDRSRSHCSEL